MLVIVCGSEYFLSDTCPPRTQTKRKRKKSDQRRPGEIVMSADVKKVRVDTWTTHDERSLSKMEWSSMKKKRGGDHECFLGILRGHEIVLMILTAMKKIWYNYECHQYFFFGGGGGAGGGHEMHKG